MNMEPSLLRKAKEYLNQLDKDLCEEFKNEKQGEEFLNRMEREIRGYERELLVAIELALGDWLRGNDEGKFLCALHLIDRLEIRGYLSELEKLYKDMQSGNSQWPSEQWIDLVEVVLDRLRKANV